jgi:hypothetical protein
MLLAGMALLLAACNAHGDIYTPRPHHYHHYDRVHYRTPVVHYDYHDHKPQKHRKHYKKHHDDKHHHGKGKHHRDRH